MRRERRVTSQCPLCPAVLQSDSLILDGAIADRIGIDGGTEQQRTAHVCSFFPSLSLRRFHLRVSTCRRGSSCCITEGAGPRLPLSLRCRALPLPLSVKERGLEAK